MSPHYSPTAVVIFAGGIGGVGIGESDPDELSPENRRSLAGGHGSVADCSDDVDG